MATLRKSRDLHEFSEMLTVVYDGIDETPPWKTLMARLSHETRSRDASLLMASSSAPGLYVLVTDNEDPVVTAQDRVDSLMPVNSLFETPHPTPMSVDELMPDGRFLHSELYRRFLQPLNIRHLLSCDVLRNDTICALLTLERNDDQPPFTVREKELLALITPHIARAMRLREQQAQGMHMQRFFEDAMARLAIACVLLDGQGRVASMNSRARELLNDPQLLGVYRGRLRCGDGVDGRALGNAIDLALAAHRNRCRSQRGVALQLGSGPGQGIFDVVVRPLIGDHLPGSSDQPAVVVYINDCRNTAAPVEPAVLVCMYGLTRCESQVAAMVACGMTLDEAADELGVSINTVKTHLRGVYEKLGTNRQSQVAARLNHSAVRLY